ncbi:DNAase [Lysobacter daejeonensis GH1-9]|uniref:DNAase n=1 Tax=Lysobacter daejeonensis GH1-9 TaxID=1385517 RepID=A0A0A0F0T1_9GAMM|nr:TatD family hydrolase [Lysobacter daejeonensis]KGM55878.1 DNAase [Lysobacter daejeonensis GH1-9]
MLVDTHCHLDAPEFDADREAVIARARAVGVTRQILPAVEAATWPKLREICRTHADLFPAYGLHPMYLAAHRPAHLLELRDWIERERPVAVGECGLDFFVEDLDPREQIIYFEQQLRLARDFDLPVIVHARRAVDQVIASIRRFAPLRGVVHSFPGSREQAERLHALGFLVSLGGPVTYERANRLRTLVAGLPIEMLMLETDSPDQPDAGIRGQRNEPARLSVILDVVARLRGETPGEVAAATSQNAERLFRLPPAP